MLTALGVAVTPAFAQIQQRARIVGGGNGAGGRCFVQVVVDGAVEVDIRGDIANLRDLSGREPQFQRFECSSVMPPNPVDFRFRGVQGRGRQALMQDPRSGGRAVVRIEDPESGADTYAFELLWSNGGGFPEGPGQGRFGERDRRMQAFDGDRVMRECQQAVRREAGERFNAANIEFREMRVDDDHDFVRGRIDVPRAPGREDRYQFACALNPDSGQVRSVRMDPIQGGAAFPGTSGPGASRAMDNCRRGVSERLRADGYGRVEFGDMRVDNRPGRGEWLVGSVKGLRGDSSDFFNFACSVELRDGDVRSVDVTRR
jgi:hypothetical protein